MINDKIKETENSAVDTLECIELEKGNGEKVRLIDYSSAGKTWANDSRCAAWLRLK